MCRVNLLVILCNHQYPLINLQGSVVSVAAFTLWSSSRLATPLISGRISDNLRLVLLVVFLYRNVATIICSYTRANFRSCLWSEDSGVGSLSLFNDASQAAPFFGASVIIIISVLVVRGCLLLQRLFLHIIIYVFVQGRRFLLLLRDVCELVAEFFSFRAPYCCCCWGKSCAECDSQ